MTLCSVHKLTGLVNNTGLGVVQGDALLCYGHTSGCGQDSIAACWPITGDAGSSCRV